MDRTTITAILLLIWAVANVIWSLNISKREGMCEGIRENTLEILDNVLGNLRKLRSAMEDAKEELKQQPVVTKEQENAEYAGVIHIFKRDKKKHERPVMVYMYKGNPCYFEYDESGKKVPLWRKPIREAIEKTMQGEKVGNFKKYEIENK